MTRASREKAKVGAAIVGVFLLGAVTGASVWHLIAARRTTDMFDAAEQGSRHGVFLWSLERKLDLNDDQRDKIDAILKAYDVEVGAVAPPPDPRVAALRDKMRDEIRAVLDDKQRKRFDEIIARHDEVRGKNRKAAPSASAPKP